MTELDDIPIETFSLCVNCAKHPELKALVSSDLGEGICGPCGTFGVTFNPSRFEAIRNLIRALIRLHFDEQVYNGHWGGTSIDDVLLGKENPILEVAKPDGFPDEFIYRVVDEGGVYPEYEEGICLFAGHDADGSRLLQFSIPETASSKLKEIERRLERENFYAVEAAMEDLVDRIAAYVESKIDEGTLWYRGRIGFSLSEIHFGFNTVTRVVTPYQNAEISALPPPLASAGRMNRAGVSVLYVASDINTALAEIRPHPGHTISVAGFRTTRSLRVARFDVPIADFCSSDKMLEEFALIYHVDSLLSLPVIPEEKHRYAATQLLADVLIRRGFDAISYRSSVGNGTNLCVFDPSLFTYDDKEAAVRFVDKLDYRFSTVATVRPDHF
jgi:hypothetical protein